MDIMQSANLNLRKWGSNCKEALERESFLNPINDSFFSTLMKINTHTKKTMLSEASSVFDPLGWLAPVGIRIRIMFKALWLQKPEL